MDNMSTSSRSDIETYKRQLLTFPGVRAVGEKEAEGVISLKVFFVDQATAESASIPDNEFGIPIIKSALDAT